ncbi:MAG TPA: hypothetical protein VF319_06480 [Caldimonas sp.]
MKKLVLLALAACAAVPVLAAPSVGVSIGINQPGVYGRINIGSYPEPMLVYPEPVMVAPAPIAVQRQPIYLYVPLAHQQNWHRYCGRYSACGQPVYFVQERWVRERWEHEHRDERRDHAERGREGPRNEHGDRGRHRGQGDREERSDDRHPGH